MILSAATFVNIVMVRHEKQALRVPLSDFPAAFGNWNSTADQQFPNWVLESTRVDEYLMRRYQNGTESIWLYIGYYRSQTEGAVPHSPRRCYPGEGWVPLKNEVVNIPVPGTEQDIFVNRYVFTKGDDRQVIIYWYQSRGRVVANEYWEKLYLIRDSILRNRSDGALVRFSISAKPHDQETAMKYLEQFVSQVYPRISTFIPD
jgi:EpsI family protein